MVTAWGLESWRGSMRLIRIAILIASFAVLFGGSIASSMAGTFCDSSLSKSKTWAPLARVCADTIKVANTIKVADTIKVAKKEAQCCESGERRCPDKNENGNPGIGKCCVLKDGSCLCHHEPANFCSSAE
jgi:hypothetical protein